jgi:hypothetical protein
MGTWLNKDGLYIKYGTSEAASQDPTKDPAGDYNTGGNALSVTECHVDLTDLNTSTSIILNDVLIVPKNARVEEIEVEVVTGAVGATATLDVGLIRTDRTTELDYNGFVAAAAVATLDTAGKRLNLIKGSTAAGALIGTTLANPGLWVAKAGTAVFTAGLIRVRAKWFAV